jgi:uncharacterized membrane protein YhhN
MGSAVLTAIFVLGLLLSDHRESRLGQWICKPLAAAGFLWAGLALGALDSSYGTWLFVGLVFSFWGDVLLIPKAKGAFLAGLISFLFAHIAYAIAFFQLGVDMTSIVWTAGAGVLGGVLILPWLLPHTPAAMKGPVVVYTLAILTMVAMAGGAVGHGASLWVLVGAVAFLISDLAVARNRFVAPGLVNRLWGAPLYFGAQHILAWTLGCNA